MHRFIAFALVIRLLNFKASETKDWIFYQVLSAAVMCASACEDKNNAGDVTNWVDSVRMCFE